MKKSASFVDLLLGRAIPKLALAVGLSVAAVLGLGASAARSDYLTTIENYSNSKEWAKAERALLAELDPEAAALRRQYQEWIFVDLAAEWRSAVLFRDVKNALFLVAYDKKCAPISPEKFKRAQLFIRAFPEQVREVGDIDDYVEAPSFCRKMNPPPKPKL